MTNSADGEQVPTDTPTTVRVGRTIGAAALILMAANLSGSLLGFARADIMVSVFGQNRHTDAFVAALIIPQMFYDLTIGAAISAALIPTFTEIAERNGFAALARTMGTILVLAWLTLLAMTVLLELLAAPIMSSILLRSSATMDAAGVQEAIRIVRVLLPTLFFLGTSAVLLSTLYAVRRFTVSAFAGALYHLGIILAALLLARPLGILALPIGALAGAAAQASIQVPVLIRTIGWPVLRIELTPEVRRILRLYAPVAAGLLVSIAGQVADAGFKWQLAHGDFTAMQNATLLTQFPIGIAVAGLSFAILPSISSDVAFGRVDDFRRTLATGMRLVLFLSIPAAVGYVVLATPIAVLLFHHHKVSVAGSAAIASALRGYAIQIPFVGIDQLLIFAFYARKNTLTPMLVGVVGVGIYVASALILLPRLHVFGLAFANTLQNSIHALILLALLFLTVGTLRGTGLWSGVGKTLLAAGAMGAGTMLLVHGLPDPLQPHGALVRLAEVLLPISAGAALYFGTCWLLGSQELRLVGAMLATRFRPASVN